MNQSGNTPPTPPRTCPQCAAVTSQQANYCVQCGADLSPGAVPVDPGPAPAPVDRPQPPSPPSPGPSPAQTVTLAVFDGHSNQRLTPAGATLVTVGKSRTCDISRPCDDHLSRRHCQISVPVDGIVVEDLGSANGTWIRLKNAAITIRSGDVIMVGHTSLRIEAEEKE